MTTPPSLPATDATQLDLLPPPPRARRADPETSKAAARSMVGGAASQRAAIVALLAALGNATNDQLDTCFGWRAGVTSRRMTELKRMGLVRATGEVRPTLSGRDAEVHVLTAAGRDGAP